MTACLTAISVGNFETKNLKTFSIDVFLFGEESRKVMTIGPQILII